MADVATITVDWDGESQAWVATSESIQGLVLQSETMDGIFEQANQIIIDPMPSHFQFVFNHGNFTVMRPSGR